MGKVEQLLRVAKPGPRGSSLSPNVLAELEPLKHLSAASLSALAQVGQTITAKKGTEIFAQGDMDPRILYLLEGQVQLARPNHATECFDQLDLRAKSPLAAEKHRSATATALTDCKLLAIPCSAFDQALAEMPASSDGYEVDEIDTADGATWIHNFLKSPVFLRLPAGNIQKILARFEEVKVEPGQLILKQGSQSNNYYVVKEGRFKVSRRPAQSDCIVELATLHAGDGFGEEALISHGQRGASVTAITAGTLMRLGRKDFSELLADPLTRRISAEQAETDAAQGSVYLDVRSPDEYRANGLRQALNIPFSLLRANLRDLDSGKTYIVYCNNGLLSAAAAFVLSLNARKALVLDGGLQNLAAKAPTRKAHAQPPAANLASRAKAKTPTAKPIVVKSQTTSEDALRLAAEKELAELQAKMAMLEENLDAVPEATDAIPFSATDIICVDHDDALLWTPIPGTSHLSTDNLKLTSATQNTPTPRDRNIICVGEADAILWEPIVTSRPKQTAEPKPAAEPAAEPANEQQSGWISDSYLWETVIGFASEAEPESQVDSLLAQAEAESRQKLEATPKPVKQPAKGTSYNSNPTRTREEPAAPLKPKKQSKLLPHRRALPLWLHGVYAMAILCLAAIGFITFFPNEEISSRAISWISAQSVKPQPALTSVSTPPPKAVEAKAEEAAIGTLSMTRVKAEATSEFTVKKHFAVEAASNKPAETRNGATPEHDVQPGLSVQSQAEPETVFGLTQPAQAPFDSFVVSDPAAEKSEAAIAE